MRVRRKMRQAPWPHKLLAVAVLLGSIVALVAAKSYVVMLLAGAVGHIFDAPVLFLGYWQAVVVVLALAALGSFITGSKT